MTSTPARAKTKLRAPGTPVIAVIPLSGIARGGGTNNTLSFGAVNVAITNPLYPKVYVINAAAGNVDLYTVPAGRLALAVDMVVTVPTGNPSSVTVLAEVKVAGVYHTFDFVANNLAAGSAGRTTSMAPFLLHAGESLSINTSAAGASVWASVIEFDASANPTRTRLLRRLMR